MRRSLCFLLAFVLLLPAAAAHAAEEDEATTEKTNDHFSVEQGVSAWMMQLDPTAWAELYALLPEETRTFWQGKDPLELIESFALAEGIPSVAELLDAVENRAGDVLRQELPLLLTFVGIALLSAFAGVWMQGNGVGGTAGFVCRCFAVTTVLTAISGRISLCLAGMNSLSKFMELALPALFTLLMAMGSAATVGVFQPTTALLCGTVSACMRSVVLPMAVSAGVIGMVACLTPAAKLDGIVSMIKKVQKWIIGALTTIYIGVMTLSGMGASGVDGLSIRTAKYAASSMVPVVGSMVSGSFDTVLGCAVLVKNAVGIAAILLSLGIVAVPIIQTVSLMFLLRLASALSGPVADKRLVAVYDAAADALQYVIAALIAVALMFVITVGLLMALTNYMSGGV